MTAESRSPVPTALYQDELVDEEAELPHRLALGGRVLKQPGYGRCIRSRAAGGHVVG